MADYSTTIAKPLNQRIMPMRIATAVVVHPLPGALAVAAEVPGKRVTPHGLMRDGAVLDLENGKIRAAPKVVGDYIPVFRGNSDLHEGFLSLMIIPIVRSPALAASRDRLGDRDLLKMIVNKKPKKRL
jgi:hypothetical protein